MRPIPGWPTYSVDERGHIFSHVRRVAKGSGQRSGSQGVFDASVCRRLRWVDVGQGYPAVTLHNNGARRRAMVHHLVLEAFVGPRPDGMQARHLDGNRWNPSLSNLCWGTWEENQADRIRHGNLLHGERHGQSRFKEKDVRQILERLKQGESSANIAKEFQVSKTAVLKLKWGHTWKHVTLEV